MSSGALDQIEQGYNALAPEVRERWAIEQIQTIRNTVGKDLTISEFQMGMALAAESGLNPLRGEMWFAKSRSRDGSPGKTLIMTGRDGFLTIARRQGGYRGIDCDVVRANDHFKVTRLPSGERQVLHEYEGTDEDRGAIKGAWAIVEFDGKIPFYYYAPLSEYLPKSDGQLKYSPWGSQVSVMILKCAQSYALRIACGISGLVGEEESASALSGVQAEAATDSQSLAAAVADVPEDLRQRLYDAYGDAADLGSLRLSPAVVQMSVKGQPRERVEAFIETIETANRNARAAAQDADVEEAEVVPDGELGTDMDDLNRQLAVLYEQRAQVEENPGDLAETEAELDRLSGEITQLEELRDAAQERLL